MWVLWEKKVVPQPFFSGPRGAAHGVPSDFGDTPWSQSFPKHGSVETGGRSPGPPSEEAPGTRHATPFESVS